MARASVSAAGHKRMHEVVALQNAQQVSSTADRGDRAGVGAHQVSEIAHLAAPSLASDCFVSRNMD